MITGVGPQSSLIVTALGGMRSQLDDLQGQLSAMAGYGDTVTQIGVRMTLQQTSLTRIADLSSAVKGATLTQFNIDASGQTATQRTANTQLDEILGLLNTPAGDRYLFSGRAGDKPATDTLDHILNGDGARAGLKQIIGERNQADLGANGLGRL